MGTTMDAWVRGKLNCGMLLCKDLALFSKVPQKDELVLRESFHLCISVFCIPMDISGHGEPCVYELCH